MARHLTVQEWLKECRSIPRRDLDNLILLTGAEGSGKSSVGYQIAKALDNSFDERRTTFTIPDFIEAAQASERGSVIMADELLVNNRKGMWGDTIQLLDFLQVCRGLNLHLLICFPHPDLLDKAIRDHRVRYWIHVPRRGMAYLRERGTTYGADGTIYHYWKLIARWTFLPNSGILWDRYLAKKALHMKRRAEGDSALPDSTFDIEALRSIKPVEPKKTPI